VQKFVLKFQAIIEKTVEKFVGATFLCCTL